MSNIYSRIKIRTKLGNQYNNNATGRELNEYVPELGLFGGKRRHKTRKNRKRTLNRLKKRKNTQHKSKK